MRAMILAAGYGTRLWPLTIDRTKPAIPFLGRPLVGYVAEYLARNGCRQAVVNLHHRPDSVRAALGDGGRFGIRLEYVEEPSILGTSGALDNARHLLEDATFAVVNGKIVTNIDLQAALSTHRRTGALATLVLRPNPARERFSIVETRDGLVTGFGGMPAPASDKAVGLGQRLGRHPDSSAHSAHPDSSANQRSEQGASEKGAAEGPVRGLDFEDDAPLMFTGIHILEPRIFDYIPRGVASDFIPHVYRPAIAGGERIAAHVSGQMWYELSTIRRYLDVSLALLREEGRDVELGPGSDVAVGAEVSESLLWENARVEAGARVRRAVLGEGVRVAPGEVIENAAVVRAELVSDAEPPPKALSGERRGENFVVPLPH